MGPFLLRPPARSFHTVHDRDVGALQLLRNARAAHLLPHRHRRARRPRLHRFQSRRRLRTLHRHGLPDVPRRRLDCRPVHRAAPRRPLRRHPDRRRRVLPDGALHHRVLPRPRPAHGGHGLPQGQRQHHRRPALHERRSAARFRFFDFLHGHQYRRASRPDFLRLHRRTLQLAAWIRPLRPGHARRRDSICDHRPLPRRSRPASGRDRRCRCRPPPQANSHPRAQRGNRRCWFWSRYWARRASSISTQI